jgi:hypothetical protein
MFDMWHRYSQIANSESWVSSLLAGEGGDPRIALVELQNEMPLSGESVSWARSLLPFLQTVLPGVPRTISGPGSDGVTPYRRLLSDIPPSDIDAVDVHYYGDPSRAAQELREIAAMAQGRPLFIGETGRSTYGTAQGEQAQARFYQIMGQTAQALDLPPPAPWMLNDVYRARGEHLDSHQEHFGLRREDGSWKPAAAVVQSIFRGDVPQSWDEQPTGSASGGNSLGSWTVFDASAGVPFTTSTPSSDGGESMCYSHTSGSPGKLPAVEQSLPVLRKGETFKVSARINRTSGTGFEQISIAEFDANNTYVGELDSPKAIGSGYWQELSVSGSEPADVTSVEIHLKAGYESGTACWGSVEIATSGY